MLDITVCSSQYSIIRFCKYESLEKTSEAIATSTFIFPFKKEEDDIFLAVGLNSHRTKVEFLINHGKLENLLKE